MPAASDRFSHQDHEDRLVTACIHYQVKWVDLPEDCVPVDVEDVDKVVDDVGVVGWVDSNVIPSIIPYPRSFNINLVGYTYFLQPN